jgi:hypothetical protein
MVLEMSGMVRVDQWMTQEKGKAEHLLLEFITFSHIMMFTHIQKERRL